MKKLNKYQLNKISKNLDHLFNLATKDEILEGMQWYKDAHNFAKDLSNKTNIHPYKIASIISILSPRNKWERNLVDTTNLCNAWIEGKGPNDIKVCTFNTNKFKAFNVLNDKQIINDKSLKTYNFVNNIAYLCPSSITIDIWHLRACFNKMIKINSATIGRLAYEQIKQLTLNKSKKLGLKGYEFQAIIWIVAKRNI